MFRVYELNGNDIDDKSPAAGYHSEAAALAAATAYYCGRAIVVIRGEVVWAIPGIKQDQELDGFGEE